MELAKKKKTVNLQGINLILLTEHRIEAATRTRKMEHSSQFPRTECHQIWLI
jgi:hypothetical protein